MTAPSARAEAVYESIRQYLPLPYLLVDSDRGLWVANQALADIFGYASVAEIERSLERREFLNTHFSSDVVAQLYELLAANGSLEGWLIRGQTLAGRDITLEVSARGALRTPPGAGQPDGSHFPEPRQRS
ncbi:PAS domain-containing protein [Deltaproteobacteria bacterium OttesenSCG-928-M10]|nr:PAS domain-containing protein [Deltaproteobacteria bacterium OttesenSCG-928-M10]